MPGVNPLGYASPLVRVFTADDEIVEKIVGFSYKHTEKGDDECQITIHSRDVTTPDKKEFKEGAKLFVTWGYINGEQSSKEKVYIRDIKVQYAQDLVKLTLTCYDKFAVTRQTSRSKIHKDTDLDKLGEDVAKANGLEYDGVDLVDEVQSQTGFRQPSFFKPGGDQATALDNVSVPRTIDFIRYEELPQGNKSDSRLLRETADREPGGPWVVEGRGDKLIIKKRDLNQAPIKSYEYGGGNFELIKFSPETKNRAHKSANVNVSSNGWDPVKKLFREINSNSAVSPAEVWLGQTTDGSPRSQETIPDPTPGEPKQVSPELANAGTGRLFKEELTTQSPTFFKNSGFQTEAIDNTATIISSFELVPIDYLVHEDTIEQTEEAQKGYGDNRGANARLKKNPATATCVGDPKVISGKVVTMLNVSKKYSGNYYITEVVHKPYGTQGYLMDLKMIKNATGKVDSNSPESIDVDSIENSTKNIEVGPQDTDDAKISILERDPQIPEENFGPNFQ